MRRAITLAKDKGFFEVIIKSDCLSLINRVQAVLQGISSCGPIIKDIKRLASSFSSCSFGHVRRDLNVPAHKLAKFGVFSVCSLWRGYTSDVIREDICNDILVMRSIKPRFPQKTYNDFHWLGYPFFPN
jgi:hypothetical protein